MTQMDSAVREHTETVADLRATYGSRLEHLFSAETWQRFELRCDRCIAKLPATEIVRCYYGCQHWQCKDCAAYTVAERERDSSAGWSTVAHPDRS